MKYIININESFDSNIIGKTMGFINNDSRKKFKSILESIANKFDIPLSNFSDDNFQYLPFKRALELTTSITDKPCDAKSTAEFGDSTGIPGETCQGGRIKRKWGASTRVVQCPSCLGYGIKKNNTQEPKWIKFWFSKDGNYIETTITDGVKRFQTPLNYDSLQFSTNIEDYNVVRELNRDEILSLPHMTIVKMEVNGKSGIGMIFKYNSNTYFLQDWAEGNPPPNDTGWRRYAMYSWNLSNLSSKTATLLEPKNKEAEIEENYYQYNAPISPEFKYGRITAKNSVDVEQKLKNAHFALVLDYPELSESKLKKRSEIKGDRVASRENVLKFRRNDDIKKENILRYIKAISNNIELTEDFAKISNIIPKIFGINKCGYYILNGRNIEKLDSIIDYLYTMLKNKDTNYIDMIRETVDSTLRSNMEYNETISRSISAIYKEMSGNIQYYPSGCSLCLPIMDKLFDLNKSINNIVKSVIIENLEDMEFFYQKVKSIRNLWINNNSSVRFTSIGRLVSVMENIKKPMDAIWYLKNICYQENEEQTILKAKEVCNGIDRFIMIIERLN